MSPCHSQKQKPGRLEDGNTILQLVLILLKALRLEDSEVANEALTMRDKYRAVCVTSCLYWSGLLGEAGLLREAEPEP